VEVSCGDLEAASRSEADSAPQAKASEEKTGSHEILLLGVVLSVLKEGRVQLDLGPDLPEYAVLEGVIPGVGPSDEVGVGRREADAKRALQIEVP
jgi:hypothetical protein